MGFAAYACSRVAEAQGGKLGMGMEDAMQSETVRGALFGLEVAKALFPEGAARVMEMIRAQAAADADRLYRRRDPRGSLFRPWGAKATR